MLIAVIIVMSLIFTCVDKVLVKRCVTRTQTFDTARQKSNSGSITGTLWLSRAELLVVLAFDFHLGTILARVIDNKIFVSLHGFSSKASGLVSWSTDSDWPVVAVHLAIQSKYWSSQNHPESSHFPWKFTLSVQNQMSYKKVTRIKVISQYLTAANSRWLKKTLKNKQKNPMILWQKSRAIWRALSRGYRFQIKDNGLWF